MHFALLQASAVAAQAQPNVPWWGKVVAGILLMVVSGILAWLNSQKNLFGEDFEGWASWVFLILTVVGFCVALWGLGVDFSSLNN